ncbi:MAG: hypothetical protein HYW01_02185 [Deltaproteobacteria bacterium]|nr:hypothetical protein [Deltaproteobacteria bacterium]
MIGSNKLSITRIIKLKSILFTLLIIAGCTSRHLVPVQDGGLINPELKSATKTEQGVTVTVRASAWRGKPSDLGSYVTPLHITIQNNSASGLSFDYEDIALLDENRTQYNPLPPETVAQILQSGHQRRYVFRPYFSFGFGYSSFYFQRFHPFFFNSVFYDPFYDPWYYPPAYYPESFDDVYTDAIFPGLVQPKAKLEGFVYFKKIPTEVKRITLEIGYYVQGKPEPHKLSFPFSIELSRH